MSALKKILNGHTLEEAHAVMADFDRHVQRLAARRRPTFVAQASAHSAPPADSRPRWRGKTYAELSHTERHLLAIADRQLFDAMRVGFNAGAR